MRKVIGVVAGVILANLVIFGWEQVLVMLPFGRTVDVERLAEEGAVAAFPLAAQLWIAGGWLLGAFLGALVAFRVSRWDFAGWIVGALVAAAGLANVFMIDHPLWMSIAAVALPFVGAVFAFGASRRWRAADLHIRH